MSTATVPTTPEQVRIKATYAHLDTLLTGIDRLKRADIDGYTVIAPIPRHEIEEMVYEGRPSPVRWWTLFGAVSGLTFGFLLPALTAAQWPMINPGGKPVVSLPPYIIIMFECTILFGGLFTLLGLIVHAGLPAISLDRSVQDPRYGDDKFGIVFTDANPELVEEIDEILRKSGAVEVTTGDDTLYEVPNV
jgi:molybdopterin-containing oxidoreductase family membrane subunit